MKWTFALVSKQNLSMGYIELVLLKLMGFSGTYSNRIKAKIVGQVEKVPWASLVP
jgi:hypothetical protein